MQRDQYKQVVAHDLNNRIIELEREISEFGHASVITDTDNMLAMLINKIGTSMTLRLVDMFADKAVIDAETFLGPDVFTDKKHQPFKEEENNVSEEVQFGGAYYFQREEIFPIEFREALITMAELMMSPKIDPGKPLRRISVEFKKREKAKDPDELRVTFFTEARPPLTQPSPTEGRGGKTR
jgi:hypothetical protein